MGWTSYRAPRKPLEAVKAIGIEGVEIRALNEQDFSDLLVIHGDALEAVYAALTDENGGFSLAEAASNPITMIRFLGLQAPAIVVDVIAKATDTDEAEKAGIASIPLGVKLGSLSEIVDFTRKSDPDLGKFLGMLRARTEQSSPQPLVNG